MNFLNFLNFRNFSISKLANLFLVKKGDAHKGPRLFIYFAILLLVGFFYWSTHAELEQVTHATGRIIANARTQVIQAVDGGVLQDLLVKEGEAVVKGQLLVVLDKTRAEAAYLDSLSRVAALRATLVRLRAQVFGRPLEFPEEVKRFPSYVQNQTELYYRREQALQEAVEALQKNLRLALRELNVSKPLLESGDIGAIEILRQERQIAELRGNIANLKNKYLQDGQTEMTQAEEQLSIQEQALSDRSTLLEHTELHAPTDGFVSTINVTTPGAALRPGETVLELLPSGGKLVVEAKIQPKDRAYVREGLRVAVKLDAFDYSIYGSLHGKVTYVSPDSFTNDRMAAAQQQPSTGGAPALNLSTYYKVLAQVDQIPPPLPGKKRIEIQPGMTVQLDIITGSRTVFAYLSKPITKTFKSSMTER